MLQVANTTVSESTTNQKVEQSEPDTEHLQHLVSKIVNRRDREALSELFDLLGNRIMYFAQRQTGDPEAAREVLQDTMMAVWMKGHTYNSDKGKVTTWLFTIVRNLCYDLARKKMSRPPLVSGESLYGDIAPEEPEDEDYMEGIDNELIIEALDRLPPPQRQVVALVFLKECSHQEAADIMGIPVGTVKSRIRLGLEKLSEALSKRQLGYE